MKIETKATKSGRFEGMPVWRGHYRIDQFGTGFVVGWIYATNRQGERIAYQDRESALAGARVCAEEFAKTLGGQDTTCNECGHALSQVEIDQDRCAVCGHPYHDETSA